MHYYPFNISDFNNSTRHLTLLERAIYRELMDMYYQTENPIVDDLDVLARKILVRSKEEKESLSIVLDEFFLKTDAGYTIYRIEQEIIKYQNRAEIAKNNGKKGGRPKKDKAEITQRVNLNNPEITQRVNSANPNETPLKANNNKNKNKNKNNNTNKNSGDLKDLSEKVTQTELLPVNNLKNDSMAEFEMVWNMYGKKGNRKTSLSRFLKMKDSDKKLMSIHLPKYIISTPDKQYRKGLQSYINLECWNDEILINNNNNEPTVNISNRPNFDEFARR